MLVEGFSRGCFSNIWGTGVFSKYLGMNSVEKKQFLARVQVLAGIISAVFVSVLAVVMALGIVHPAIIVLASVLGLIAFVSLMKCAVDVCRKHIMPPCSIPSGCLQVICDNYPLVIGDLCKQERLTIQELRRVLSVLRGLEESGLEGISGDLRKKLDTFGWQRLVEGCRDQELLSLDDVLTRSCCLYFLKRFIDLGPKDIPASEGMLPEVYWMSPTGLRDVADLAFTCNGWLLANVLTEQEYILLRERAKSGQWVEKDELLEDIKTRCKNLAKKYEVLGYKINYHSLLSVFFGLNRVFCFFRHGMSWEQVQLIKMIPIDLSLFFSEYEGMGRVNGMGWVSALFYFYPFLDESSPQYDPGIALMTLKEFVETINSIKPGIAPLADRSYQQIIYAITQHAYRSSSIASPEEVFNHFWFKGLAEHRLYDYEDYQRSRMIFSRKDTGEKK